MRPIRLKISAFGAFLKPVDLDFESGLRGEKIFLINGATGAGKSTILDAICYALYDESSGRDRKIKNMRSEQATDEVTEVEFTFALGEKIIKIYRLLSLDTKTKKIVEIYEDGKLKISDAKDASVYIKNLLGFKAEQFRQVVMLPQGKFREFLMAGSLQRGEILNVIFDSTIYAEIEQKLKERAKIISEKLSRLTDERKNIYSEMEEILRIEKFEEKNLPEYLKSAEKNVIESKKSVENLKKIRDKSQENFSSGKNLSNDFEHYENLEKNLKNLLEEMQKLSAQNSAVKSEYKKLQSEDSQNKELEGKIYELKNLRATLENFQKQKSELLRAENDEKIAGEEIKNLDRSIGKCEDELKKIQEILEKVAGADVKFKDAEQKLNDSRKRQEKNSEILRLKEEMSKSRKILEIAEKNFDSAQKNLDRLNYILQETSAAKLAQNLLEGEACPVCGAIHHPKLAISDKIIPTEKEFKDAEEELKKFERELKKSQDDVTKIETKMNLHEEEMKKFAGVLEITEAEKFFEIAKKDAEILEHNRNRLKNGEVATKKKISDREAARKIFDTKSKIAENLRGTIEATKKILPEKYFLKPERLAEDLDEFEKILSEKKLALKLAEEKFQHFDKIISMQKLKIKLTEDEKKSLAEKISGKEKPDIEELKKILQTADENHSLAMEKSAKISEEFKRLEKISVKLGEISEKILFAEKNNQIWTRLSEVANGKNNSKISFQRYYLGAMFGEIIFESNIRLEKISGGRYKFLKMETVKDRKQSAGLDLEIFDAYTGKARPVETLSGGESFLASLSLALGLAAVVKNTSGGINLDTIFIDEGFGTLDSETLDTAINTLEELQSDGRLVGIISHVDELKQRIPARLSVKKTKFGSFASFEK